MMRQTLDKSSASTLPGADDTTRAEYPNGIVVLSRANHNSPSVYLAGYFQAGALFESDEKLGLADFTAGMLMRGTHKRSFQEIYDALESVGASFGYSSGVHTTGFAGRALAEDLDLLLDVFSETLFYPEFPHEQIERLRAQLLAELAIRAQDTDSMASLTFDQIVYDGHPYSRPKDGYPDTIQRISREDMLAFHKGYYGPRGMVIAIVGGIEPSQAVEKIAHRLGEWQNPQQPLPPALPPVKPLSEIVRRATPIAGKSQVSLMLGVAGPPRTHPHYLAAALGNNILGQFGLYGRIGDVVREQEGLAYYAYSQLSGGIGPGPWYVTAGVAPENVERVIELVRAEIRRFTTEPVSTEELSDSQAHFVGILPISLESNSGVASALLNLERYQLGLDYYRRYADLVRAVTPEDILAVSRQFLDADRLGIALAGTLAI